MPPALFAIDAMSYIDMILILRLLRAAFHVMPLLLLATAAAAYAICRYC